MEQQIIMDQQASVRLIREHNRYLVMRLLLQNPGSLRRVLAEDSGVSLMTIKHIVDDLLAKKLVTTKKVNSASGRKPQALEIAPRFGCIGCVSFSSRSHVTVYVYNIYGKVLLEESYPIEDDYLKCLDFAIRSMRSTIAKSDLDCLGIGFSFPSVYYENEDRVNYDLVDGLRLLRPMKLARKYFSKAPVYLMHDVKLAAAANHEVSDENGFFYMYFGDGVASCYIDAEGEILQGEHAMAGEIGQTVTMCNGSYKTLEQVASTVELEKRLSELSGQDAEINFEKLYKKNPEAAKIIDEAASAGAAALYNANWLLNPSRIMLDSANSFYAQLIADKTAQLAEQMNTDGIAVGLNVQLAEFNQQHAIKGLFEHILEVWLRAACR